MAQRRDVTAGILALLPEPPPLDQALKTWYRNTRAQGGFRLTELGYEVLCSAAVNRWSVPLQPRDLTKTALLLMDHRIAWPYYIHRAQRRLILFSSRDAVMANLYGDLNSWLASLDDRDAP